MIDERLRARAYTRAHGEDAPVVSEWRWVSPTSELAP
jgi:xylulose-5-phosphate/fructose-6-phosphate phosphoketolase